ncbi:hypothetical protein PHYPSEUDO_010184 [Phytophthora pseudosyringae]|uniref:Uncharacterized protein n=1 Tax=Phytophthora pseudosyringae TaxID=221518 RepID=A0A8T1WD18_9STRA|nr:hypothetical protein PHYPSEUDO_010184 [Phytophthora pseudosyringae]
MQSNHFTSHDLDLLESYVHDCIQQLPKLPAAADAAGTDASTQIPTRCSAYHTVCTNMLKEVVSLLSLFSPRLCRLIGQVWDLASLNVFVLLQVANTALQEAQQLRDQLTFMERFHAEGQQRQTALVQRYEDELARQRVNEQGLRAELQKVRQRANCLAVENGKLHLVVSRVLDEQATMDATRYDSSTPAEQMAMHESDGSRFCEDIAAVGDVEERELYGVGDGDGDEDALGRIETVHLIESYATDFEQLFRALFEGEERNVRMLNEMDRFINSTAVALLWRYGSTEEEHRMMHRMLSASTVGSQTDGPLLEKPSRLSSRRGDQWESESADDETEDDGKRAQHLPIQHHAASQEEHGDGDDEPRQNSAQHEVMAVTKHQVIPATLRSQLDSRPRVHRVLEKAQLNRILLRLYLEKLECDARTLRRRRVLSASISRDTNAPDQGAVPVVLVRTPLHRFMKEFFLARYEVPALADFHMMEVVKSCIYYHEQLKAALRRGAVFASAALVGCLPENLVQHHQHQHQHHNQAGHQSQELSQQEQQQQFVAADVRVALFSRLCELVPFDTRGPAVDSAAVGGNVSACLMNAVVDVLGDVLELDPSVPSLAAVEEVLSEASWGFPRGLAVELLTRHLPFVDQEIIDDTKAGLARLAPVSRTASGEDADCIAVDVFLALFASTWIHYDQRLESKLRESFRHQLLLSSPFARKQLADATDTEGALQRDSEGLGGRPMSRMGTKRPTMLPAVAVGAAAIAMHSSPLELLAQAWSTLENETLSSLDVEELENTFRALLDAKQVDAKHRRRQSVRKPGNEISEPTGPALSLGGVSEKEFVFHALQVLRRRRNNYGLRTNSRRPPRFAVYGGQCHATLGSAESDEISIPLDALKPGLTSESLAYVSK